MLNAISLFCSSGIGDLGLKNNNINTVISTGSTRKSRNFIKKQQYKYCNWLWINWGTYAAFQ